MTRNRLFFVLGTVLAGALIVATSGCETDSASDLAVNISPSGGKLKAGQTIRLTASGGWNYQWSCDQNKGYLSKTTGSTVNYTAFSSASNTHHTITVTGFGSGSGSSSTNSTSSSSFAASSSATATFKSE